MKYITPTTVIGFISIAILSVIADAVAFQFLEGQSLQTTVITIASIEIIFITAIYLVCFKYMKTKLQKTQLCNHK